MRLKCKECGKLSSVPQVLGTLLTEQQVRTLVKKNGGRILLWCGTCNLATHHLIVEKE